MRKIFLSLFVLANLATFSFAKDKSGTNYQLSSHILDISKGLPASNVTIILYKQNDNKEWVLVDEKVTDENGRIKDFLPMNVSNDGIYKLTYLTKPYFNKDNIKSFYPFIEVVFEINGNGHYHVPITLSPFGYSTYRGN